MEQVIIIGIDLAKNSFQLHGARADGSVAFRKKVSRAKLLDFVAEQPRATVAMEACGGAHHWGREIGGLGHAVRLTPPVYVKPYVQAAEERRCGRRGDLRGGLAAYHAVCGCEDGGTVAADRVGPSSITVLKRKRSRPSPRMSDRIFWIILSCLWPDGRHSLGNRQAETVILGTARSPGLSGHGRRGCRSPRERREAGSCASHQRYQITLKGLDFFAGRSL